MGETLVGEPVGEEVVGEALVGESVGRWWETGWLGTLSGRQWETGWLGRWLGTPTAVGVRVVGEAVGAACVYCKQLFHDYF
jgi:hypothetical protein